MANYLFIYLFMLNQAIDFLLADPSQLGLGLVNVTLMTLMFVSDSYDCLFMD